MKALKLKTKATDGTGLPTVTLAHPTAKLGNWSPSHHRATVDTVEIFDIPDEIPTAEVVRLWTHTCNATWLQAAPRFRFAFAELGIGKIIAV